MPKWLKILITASTGFLTGAVTAQQTGGKKKGILIGGGVSAVLAVATLVTESPLRESPLRESPLTTRKETTVEQVEEKAKP